MVVLKDEMFIMRASVSDIEVLCRSGRVHGRWTDRVKEYVCEEMLEEEDSLNRQGGSVRIVS